MVTTLQYEQTNPRFDFASWSFYVNTCVQDWKRASGRPLRAAVSSFGFSGTNAHLVVEEYLPARRDGAVPRPETPSLFVLSAKSESQLKSYAREMILWIQTHAEQALSDIAFTCQVGRLAMEYRLAIEADSREVLLQRLEEFVNNQVSTGVYTAQVKKGAHDTTLFETDADGQSLLRIWCQKRNLANIAQVWVRGVSIDWDILYTLVSVKARDASAMQHRIS